MPDLFVVWSDGSVALAIIAGFALGFASGQLSPGRATASPRRVFARTVFGTALIGAVFYIGQATVSDDNAVRVISRFLLWLVYSVALGVGVYARIKVMNLRRYRELHERAEQEVQAVVDEVDIIDR